MNSEDKVILAKAEDKARLCSDNSMITFSDFLDMRSRSLLSGARLPFRDVRCVFFGGFDGAERSIAVWLPEYTGVVNEEELRDYFIANPDDNPVKIIEVIKDKFSPPLSHRDYLGALMALGIKREMTGDIVVNENGCRIAVLEKAARFITDNLGKAGRGTLSAKIIPFEQALKSSAATGMPDTFTVSSMRLDSVVKNGFGVSRSAACDAITAGIVFVNDTECLKADKKISAGDKIVLRRRGRIIINDCSSLSKKGRVIVHITRFV